MLCLVTIRSTISIVSAAANIPKVPASAPLSNPGPKLTRLDDVGADILNTRLDLLGHKVSRHDVDALNAEGVLRRESRGGRHSVAAMRGDDLLVGFKSPKWCLLDDVVSEMGVGCVTYAPPELSEPAMTSTLP